MSDISLTDQKVKIATNALASIHSSISVAIGSLSCLGRETELVEFGRELFEHIQSVRSRLLQADSESQGSQAESASAI